LNPQIVYALAFLICRRKPSAEFQEHEAMSRLHAKPDPPASEMHATLRRLVESTKDVATSLALRRELPTEKRVELVGMLWELALCDDDLHPKEEERVQRIAEFVGVTGLRALAEKMNTAAGRAARDDDKGV
jgi:uncharacterized tellurite resistance protein B-like protein